MDREQGQNVHQRIPDGTMTFIIEIFNYYFGRVMHKTCITPEYVCSEQHIQVKRHLYSKHRRALTVEESRSWTEFLSDFPLHMLKDGYVNQGVKDGKQMRFIMHINNEVKDVYVANYYIRELGEMVNQAVKLLPEDYIQYHRGTVRTEIAAYPQITGALDSRPKDFCDHQSASDGNTSH